MYKPTRVEITGYAIIGVGAILMFSTQLFSSIFNSLNLHDPFQKNIASMWSMMALLGGFALALFGVVKSIDMEKWHQEFPRICQVCESGMKAEEPYEVTMDGYAHQDKEVCNKEQRTGHILKYVVISLIGAPIIGILTYAVYAGAGLFPALGLGGLLTLSFYLLVWIEKTTKGVS